MSAAQRLGIGLFYSAMAALGAAYAVFEHHQASRLAHFIKDAIPAFLILIVALIAYAFFRIVISALKELDGISRAAHATLYADYGK